MFAFEHFPAIHIRHRYRSENLDGSFKKEFGVTAHRVKAISATIINNHTELLVLPSILYTRQSYHITRVDLPC